MKHLEYYVICGALLFSVGLSYAFYKKLIAEERQILEEATYNLVNTWELPELLNEVSGIAWVNDSTIACIQDEEGAIYHFNLNTGEISYDTVFSENADYEALALDQENAYVMRSDGRIFEILDYVGDNQTVQHFDTAFDEDNNMESLTLDPKSRELITVAKDEGLEEKDLKGLYRIDIGTRKQEAQPFMTINMKDKAFEAFQKKDAEKTFSPSDLAIHPKTGDYYIVDGKKPKLLILSATGKVKAVHELNPFHFAQPESITFSPQGTLYIANEAATGVATLHQVTLEEPKLKLT